ncbi:hypothetical protein J6590_094803 [Homalodisca vitripennis]|nr:hypothetical protein J6590_094803 [Homalodisca vitripennis]
MKLPNVIFTVVSVLENCAGPNCSLPLSLIKVFNDLKRKIIKSRHGEGERQTQRPNIYIFTENLTATFVWAGPPYLLTVSIMTGNFIKAGHLAYCLTGPLAYCQFQSCLLKKFAVHDVPRVDDVIGYPIRMDRATMSSGRRTPLCRTYSWPWVKQSVRRSTPTRSNV